MSDPTPNETPHRQPLSVFPETPTPPPVPPTPTTTPKSEPASATEPPAQRLTDLERKLLEGQVIKAIRSVYDPEIPINIYELGLIYGIDVDDSGYVRVRMTLTAPACPVAGSLPADVERRVEAIPEVRGADVELVWEPPWSKDMMSEAARLALDMF
jgi:FeS assembly SUF system protein